MNRTFHRSAKLTTSLAGLLLMTLLITGCAKSKQDALPQPTSTLVVENLPLPTSTTVSPTTQPPTPTPSQIIAQTDTDFSEITNAGLFLLAMGDGKYHHLFVYHPVHMSLTRLTAGEFDYNDPVVSPDGRKIAFCANSSGKWEIHVLDLLTGEQNQITQTGSYACSPSWSPDSLWLAYETLLNGKLAVMLQSSVDLTAPSIQLTDNTGNNFDPAWSPGGREIAFVTDRNVGLDIWQADLNAVENHLSPLMVSDVVNFSSPNWSMDGTSLVWSKLADNPLVERRNFALDNPETVALGAGSLATWSTGNNGITAILRAPNKYELVSFDNDPTRLLFQLIHLPDEVTSITWQSGPFVSNVNGYIANNSAAEPVMLFEAETFTLDSTSGLFTTVAIENLEAPRAYLSDSVNERFIALREQLNVELGWDFLGILENAAIGLPSDTQNEIRGNWFYTGRAIAVNLDPLDAGWMTASREDYNGRTYWRVWLKCMQQDGTCGAPIKTQVWDFSAPKNAESSANEIYTSSGSIPEGYWLDFTSYALRFGWERTPAASTWRNYFPSTNINVFVLSDGLTWQQAMLQLYTVDQLKEFLQ